MRRASWLLSSWLLSNCMLVGVGASGCTRENPAFEGGDELVAEGDTLGSDMSESETGTVAQCEYDEGQTLSLTLPAPCGETENPLRYDRNFLVLASTTTGWIGGLCAVGSSDCSGLCPTNVPQAIDLGAFDVSEVVGAVGAGACLRISAAQRDPSLDSCNFDAVGIWYEDKPIVVASNGYALIGEALDDAGQIVPQLKLAENPPCDCVDDCCVVSPGDYRFEVGGQTIPVGPAVPLEAYPTYQFHPLSAYNPTGCMDDMQQAWALTYSP